MKQRNQKHIALLSVVLVPALLLSACGSGASGQLSSSSTAPGSEPAVSVSQPEPEPQPAVTTLRFSATGDNLIHDGLYLQARSRAGGEGYVLRLCMKMSRLFIKTSTSTGSIRKLW
ncbi:MAG: hypothetical protein ACLR7U_02835 [Ruthenibacterium lactatiformans]